MYALSGCMLHTAQSAEGEWVVVQPALSIGGLGGGVIDGGEEMELLPWAR